jgi:hypothetical protein
LWPGGGYDLRDGRALKLNDAIAFDLRREMSERVRPKRGLSEAFMEALQEESGCLHAILERVRKDDTLCLEIRHDEVHVYYRGGKVLGIARGGKGFLVTALARGYLPELGDAGLPKPRRDIQYEDRDSGVQWVAALPKLKEAMDLHFKAHPGEEREYKQLVVRDNNGRYGTKATDYFIIDLEYKATGIGALFDFIAVRWPSTGKERKRPDSLRLVFIEMKAGDGAIKGRAGLSAHLEDIEKFCKKQSNGSESEGLADLKAQMLKIYGQKRRLGLIGTKHAIRSFSDEDPLFLFLLANHDPEKSALREELKRLPQATSVEVCFAVSTFMGYGLYDQGILSLAQIREHLALSI